MLIRLSKDYSEYKYLSHSSFYRQILFKSMNEYIWNMLQKILIIRAYILILKFCLNWFVCVIWTIGRLLQHVSRVSHGQRVNSSVKSLRSIWDHNGVKIFESKSKLFESFPSYSLYWWFLLIFSVISLWSDNRMYASSL